MVPGNGPEGNAGANLRHLGAGTAKQKNPKQRPLFQNPPDQYIPYIVYSRQGTVSGI